MSSQKLRFAVFDLDGTLSDDGHRHHFMETRPKDWESYNKACPEDPPNEALCRLARSLYEAHCRVEIWTGRPDRIRPQTEEWLRRHEVPCHRLRMRSETDGTRPVNEVKGEWLRECGEDRPDLIFDDRTKTVRSWREQGMVCLQVAQHDY